MGQCKSKPQRAAPPAGTSDQSREELREEGPLALASIRSHLGGKEAFASLEESPPDTPTRKPTKIRSTRMSQVCRFIPPSFRVFGTQYISATRRVMAYNSLPGRSL